MTNTVTAQSPTMRVYLETAILLVRARADYYGAALDSPAQNEAADRVAHLSNIMSSLSDAMVLADDGESASDYLLGKADASDRALDADAAYAREHGKNIRAKNAARRVAAKLAMDAAQRDVDVEAACRLSQVAA